MMWIGGSIPPEAAAAIQSHLAHKSTKSALKKAKSLHGELGTPDSEALLVEVYVARIGALRAGGLVAEAAALEQLILRRYASARKRLQAPPTDPPPEEPWQRDLACLNDPTVDAARREAVEKTIRREVTDLRALAACPHLPEDHALRGAAAAVVRAFEAVTQGPVADQQIALPEVSRRSPLADWKTLVRAIAYFYRSDDGPCRKLLELLDGQHRTRDILAESDLDLNKTYQILFTLLVTEMYEPLAEPMSQAEPRAKDEAWNEQRENPE